MPSLEQYFEWNKPLHSVIIARSRPICTKTGRSLVDCLSHIQTLERHGVRFLAITQGLDTNQNDPAGRFLLHILGAAAEFERSLIRERVHAGIKAARKAGKPLGRPKRVFNRAEIHELRAQGLSIRDIAARLDVGMGTVARTLSEPLPQAA